ncbi:MAG: hypothetical protein ACT4PM_04095 [Gemmatimonadales bacterium]
MAARAQSTERTLNGTWKLNPERTAEEAEVQKGRDPTTREGYGRTGSVRPGTGRTDPQGGGGSGGGAPGGGVAPAGLGPVGVYARPLPEVMIAQNDSTVTLNDPSGQPRILWLDGRKETVQMPGTEPMEISARWKGGKLTVERKFTSLGSVREVYSLSKDGKELIVDVRLTAPALTQPMDSKRVYDASAAKE